MKLSICIPTYNRAEYLREAIDSILEQISDQVEIAICDNGSIDRTPEIVAAYLQKYPRIRYFRFEKNVGPDRCFLKAIEIAKGEYGWFLGDDDAIEKGSIQTVLDMLDRHVEITGMSVNRKIYDRSLQNELPWEPVCPGLLDDRIYMSSKQCIEELFTYFGYMSGQICLRARWLEVVHSTNNIEKFFNAYSILAIIVKMVTAHPRWLYCHRAIVKYRTGNDSFTNELGPYKRFLLDAVGYETLARLLFGRYTLLYRSTLERVVKTHIQARLFVLKKDKPIRAFVPRAFFVLLPRYFTTKSFWIKNCLLLFLPQILYPFVRFIYRRGKEVLAKVVTHE